MDVWDRNHSTWSNAWTLFLSYVLRDSDDLFALADLFDSLYRVVEFISEEVFVDMIEVFEYVPVRSRPILSRERLDVQAT